MDWGNLLKTIGGAVAAPFTGGATIPLAISGAAGLAGGLSNTQGARTSTTTPLFSPQDQTVANLLRSRLTNQLNTPVSTSGYEANGIAGINNAYQGVGNSLNNSLEARGLATSPIAGNALTKLALGRAGDISSFTNTLPMVQNQLNQQNTSNLQTFLNSMRGSSTVNPGSAAGSGIGSAAEMLAYLSGKGAFGGAGGSGGSGNTLGIDPSSVPDIGTILSGLGV